MSIRRIMVVLAFALSCNRSQENSKPAVTHAGSGGAAIADAQLVARHGAFDGNVLFIMIDTLRADRLGVAGYKRNERTLTPNLDAFAATASRFSRAYSQAANTPRSYPSLMTSRLPSQIAFHRSAHNNFPPVLDSNVLLFEVLAAAGLHTVSVSSHFYFLAKRNVTQGFIDYDNAGARTIGESNPDYAAPRIVPNAIARLEALTAEHKRFAMFVHLFEPHSTYIDHPEYPVTTTGEAGLVERYDYEIAIVDKWIGKLLGTIDRLGVADNTMVVILSDHGEAFGTHAAWGNRAFFHGQTLYDEILRVPLMIRLPDVTPNVRDELVALIDVAPTILDALGLAPPDSFLGRSLLPAMRGGELTPRSVVAELLPTPDLAHMIRAVITADGKHKLLTYGGGRDPELYDLAADPGEQNNLADSDADRVKQLRAELERFVTTTTSP